MTPKKTRKMRNMAAFPLTLFAMVALAACGGDDAETAMDETAATETEAVEEPMASETETDMDEIMESDTALPVSQLSGSTWELVAIRSMDDTEWMPEDASQFTLMFAEDGGMASVRADCNRGTGTYTSASPGQIEFGPVAVTAMACPDGSMGQRYLSHFENIRSYVMENGHLFLATMADGAILEFRPVS